jgi:hypothetical protein
MFMSRSTSLLASIKVSVLFFTVSDGLCVLVVRVLGYSSGGPDLISGTTRKKVVGLERGPLDGITEELLDRKVTAPV